MSDIKTNISVNYDGDVTIERIQDVEPTLEYAKTMREVWSRKYENKKTDLYHAAQIPAVVIERYIKSKGISFQEYIRNPEHSRNMLRDPALAAFRIWKGKV